MPIIFFQVQTGRIGEDPDSRKPERGNQLEKNATGTANSNRNNHRFGSRYSHSSETWDLDANYDMNTSTNSSINTQLSDVLNVATGATSRNASSQGK